MEIFPINNIVQFPKPNNDYTVTKIREYSEIRITYTYELYSANGNIERYTINNVNTIDYMI